MTAYLYPNTRHQRVFKPIQYKNYRSYKKTLQHEFHRLCVYCREPDSLSSNQIYAIDHYRPKSKPAFKSLISSYENLYYCCPTCNSFKTDYWPANEKSDPWIVNPCEHQMSAHLRFSSETGLVTSKTVHGQYTIDLLKLNSDILVGQRRATLRNIARASADKEKYERKLANLAAKQGIDAAKRTQLQKHLSEMLALAIEDIQRLTGELALPPLPKSRMGKQVLA